MKHLKTEVKEKVAKTMCNFLVRKAETALDRCFGGITYEPKIPLELLKNK